MRPKLHLRPHFLCIEGRFLHSSKANHFTSYTIYRKIHRVRYNLRIGVMYMKKSSKLDQQLCFEIYKASSNFTKMYARVLEPFNLTFTQYLVLLVLWEEDHLQMKVIGERLGLGTGTLNPIISRMMEHGRLTKQQSAEDKRAWIISLSEEAKSEQQPIERAIAEKLIHCNFVDINAVTLMKNLKELNAFFGEMDL